MANQSDGDGWAQRAERASSDLEAHRQLEEAKIELRNRLVVEGIDRGHTTSQVAHALKISQGRVTQILADCG